MYIYIYISKYCYLQANCLILFRIYFCNNVAFVYWVLRKNNKNLQCDFFSLKYTIITLSLMLPMKHLCKIKTSNYIICLKTTLKNHQTSGRGLPALLQKLKSKQV